MKTQWHKLLFILLLLIYACNSNKNDLKSEERYYEDPQNAANFIEKSDSNFDGKVFLEDPQNPGNFIEKSDSNFDGKVFLEDTLNAGEFKEQK